MVTKRKMDAENKEILDLKDRKILYELDINSRRSYGQIGRKVKLPKTVVHYRINSLEKKGILKNTYAIVNFTKLGFSQYKLYLKFYGLGLQKEKEIIAHLVSKKNIVWVTSCRGKWDLAVTIIAKDVVEFDKILKEILDFAEKNIFEKDIVTVSFSPLYSRAYLLQEKRKQEFLYMKKIENKKIEELDEKILKILANNSRIFVLDIMEKLNLTRDIVSYRIKKMEKEGIILGYRALINLEKINYHLYKIILRLQNFSEKEETELIYFCSLNSNIVQYMRLVGNWDVEIEVEIENEEKLYAIINEMRSRFSSLIKDYEVLHIVEEHKLNFYPL